MKTNMMYREEIIDLYKNPINFGKLDKFTHTRKGYNPVCGDDVTIELIVENEKIKDVGWIGVGCAISSVATSLLTEKIRGMKINDVKKISAHEIVKMLNIPISYVRIKCATLSLVALKGALKNA